MWETTGMCLPNSPSDSEETFHNRHRWYDYETWNCVHNSDSYAVSIFTHKRSLVQLRNKRDGLYLEKPSFLGNFTI